MTLNSGEKFEQILALGFQEWHEELGELSIEHSKVWKIIQWWDFFAKSMFQLENFRGIMYHDTEGWCKI